MQFATGKIGRQGAVANWLSGYLNAKRDNTTIDVAAMAKNVKKLELYCLKHHEELLMEAAKNVFGSN
jgi:HdeA/HdeB family protein